MEAGRLKEQHSAQEKAHFSGAVCAISSPGRKKLAGDGGVSRGPA